MTRYLQLAEAGKIQEEFIGMNEIRLYLKDGNVKTISSSAIIRKAILAQH
jgi:hypothetical protein